MATTEDTNMAIDNAKICGDDVKSSQLDS